MRKAKIYVIKDPQTKAVVYVGKTVQKLTTRLFVHMNVGVSKIGEYCKGWKAKGVFPIVETIEECDESIWQERETFWINAFKEMGCTLLNVTGGGLGSKGRRLPDSVIDAIAKKCQKTTYAKHKITGEIIEGVSHQDLGDKIGATKRAIAVAINRKGGCKGYLISHNLEFPQSDYCKNYKRKVPVFYPVPEVKEKGDANGN